MFEKKEPLRRVKKESSKQQVEKTQSFARDAFHFSSLPFSFYVGITNDLLFLDIYRRCPPSIVQTRLTSFSQQGPQEQSLENAESLSNYIV